MFVKKTMFSSGDVPPWSTFPSTVEGRSSDPFILHIDPTGIWTKPIFYGDSQKGSPGSNGCYFQFEMSHDKNLHIASSPQGQAICGSTATMIYVNFTQ